MVVELEECSAEVVVPCCSQGGEGSELSDTDQAEARVIHQVRVEAG